MDLKAWTLTFRIRSALEAAGSTLNPAAALTIHEVVEQHEQHLTELAAAKVQAELEKAKIKPVDERTPKDRQVYQKAKSA